MPDNVKRTVGWTEVDIELETLLKNSGGGASNVTEVDQPVAGAPASTAAAAAAVTAVVGGATTTGAAAAVPAATKNGDVGVAPPSNVVGEDAVICAE